MQNQLEEIIRDCTDNAARRNLDVSELIGYLHNQEVNIIDSIKVVSRVFNLSLGEAKKLVSSHSAWSEVAETSAPLHDELLQALDAHAGMQSDDS